MHENRGLNPYIEDVTRRLAKDYEARLNELPDFTPETLFPRFKESRIVYPFHGGVRWSPWHHLNVTTLFGGMLRYAAADSYGHT